MQRHVFSRRDILKLPWAAALIGLLAPLHQAAPLQAAEPMKNSLVVYFSMPETDKPQNMTRDEVSAQPRC